MEEFIALLVAQALLLLAERFLRNAWQWAPWSTAA